MTVQSPRKHARLIRTGSFAAQALLILITAALIYAIWLPAIVGPSEEKQRRNEREDRRLLR